MNLAELLQLTRPLVSLDLETTGIHTKVDRVVQIGIIKIYPDGSQKEWKTLINPEMLIPSEATKVHHITDEMVGSAPHFSELAPKLLAGFQECDFIGYNIKFDLSFLNMEFGKCGLVFTSGKIVDGFRIFQRQEPRNLVAAKRFFLGEDFKEAHDALEDARASIQIVEAQLERYPELPRSVSELHALFNETISPEHVEASGKISWRNGEAALSFGKHGGVLLRDAPRQYLAWMATGDFSEEVRRIAREAMNGKFPKKPGE